VACSRAVQRFTVDTTTREFISAMNMQPVSQVVVPRP
jgi:hypothetical protein